MWLTYGRTSHVGGMTDRCVLSVPYGRMSLNGMSERQLT